MDSRISTLKHINLVHRLLTTVSVEISDRGLHHDASKLESPEKEIFDEFIPRLERVEYGSAEYYELISQMKPAIDHHNAHNRHHPEFHDDGIHGMTLVDLIEMLCDWKAATMRTEPHGNVHKSLDIAFERQRIPQPLYRILKNTINEWWPNEGS